MSFATPRSDESPQEDWMEKGRPVLTFALNVAGIVILTALLAPLAMPIVDLLFPIVPGMPDVLDAEKYPGGYDFARVWRTVNQIVIMGFLLVNMKRMGFTSLAALGFPGRARWKTLFLQGFFWGLVAYLVVVGIALVLGVRSIRIRTPWWLWLKEPVEFMMSGIAAGLVEETIFRGMFFPVLARWITVTGSMLLTSVLYGSFHLLVDARVPVKSGTIDWSVGIRGFQEHLWVLVHPREGFFPAFFGLFLMSVVLTYAFLWTGSLYFPIGLHAGWVFIDKADNLFLNRGGLRQWLFGGEGIGAALFAWIAMMLFLFYVALRYRTQRFRDARISP
jgi:membrane protease YdiL (CAAX protease family)